MKPSGHSSEQLDRDWLATVNAQHVRFSCAHCDWTLESTLAEGRREHARHRKQHGAIAARNRTKMVCDREGCTRITQSTTRLCPKHRKEAWENANARSGGSRPSLGPMIASLAKSRYERGYNREDVPAWG